MKRFLVVAIFMCVALTGTANAAVPSKYRYTGVVGPIAAPAGHYISEGDGLKFFFADSAKPGARYRLCVSKTAGGVVQCWARRVNPNYVSDAFQIGNFANPRYGALVARWYVNGRVVASWSFYYATGD